MLSELGSKRDMCVVTSQQLSVFTSGLKVPEGERNCGNWKSRRESLSKSEASRTDRKISSSRRSARSFATLKERPRVKHGYDTANITYVRVSSSHHNRVTNGRQHRVMSQLRTFPFVTCASPVKRVLRYSVFVSGDHKYNPIGGGCQIHTAFWRPRRQICRSVVWGRLRYVTIQVMKFPGIGACYSPSKFMSEERGDSGKKFQRR